MNAAALLKVVNFYGRFTPSFTAIGYRARGLPGRPRYPGLAGKRIVISGASAGIGASMALAAAENGAEVIAIGRNREALDDLIAQCAGPGRIEAEICDLSLAAETRALAERLCARGSIDALVNNVGILDHRYSETDEGVARMYAVNILNPFILTEALIACGALKAGSTLVNMASGGLYNAPQNLIYMKQKPEGFSGVAGYATHKRAQIVLTNDWAARGFAAYTMHPGWVDTPGVQRSLPKFRKILHPILRNGAQGADTALWLIENRPEPVDGALWFDRKPRTAHAYARTRQPLASDADVIAMLKAEAGL